MESLVYPSVRYELACFVLAGALAMLAGSLAAIQFGVVVIGGIGSVKGAMVAAILIGIVDTFGKVIHVEVAGVQLLPELAGMTVYELKGVVLLWRPDGIFGKRL